MNLYTKTIEELHELLVNNELTVVELVESTFESIEQVEDQVEAFISLTKDEALATAKKIDERGVDRENLLDGIPIAIKDNIVTKDSKTTAASKILEDFESVFDATVIENLKEAGMIVVGKVNMDEFAMGVTTQTSKYRKTKNPWDLARVPGGSSGGSAVAVAAGMVPAALGSDTGGSIRQPASFTNLVGLKPTYGAVSRYGLIAFASSLDQIGPVTRTVKDNAVLFNAMTGKDEKDSTSADINIDFTQKIGQDINGLKIGIPDEFFREDVVNKDVLELVEKAVAKLESLGAEIVNLSMPHLKFGIPAYYAIASAEASSNLQRYDGIRYGHHSEEASSLEELYVKTRTEGFGKEVKRRIFLGGITLDVEYYEELFNKAAKIRTVIRQEFEKALSEVDVLISPTATTVAPLINDDSEEKDLVNAYIEDILTVPVNLAGVPSLNIPVGFSNGLPVGMQIIGNYFAEDVLYQTAYAYEQVTDHHKKYPTLEGGISE